MVYLRKYQSLLMLLTGTATLESQIPILIIISEWMVMWMN